MLETSMIFDRLDEWRHLPKYQLERRADIFFSLYIPEALERHYGQPINPTIIPEFPIRKRTIGLKGRPNLSVNMDYLVVSESKDMAYFVELKTDMFSLVPKQKKNMQLAKQAGLPRLLEGVLELARKTAKQRKYLHLLILLEKIGLLRVPPGLKELMSKRTLHGIQGYINDIQILHRNIECEVVYIQPIGVSKNVIEFAEFAEVVKSHDDPISMRFVESLITWTKVKPGGVYKAL
jgi:hypothetical protein